MMWMRFLQNYKNNNKITNKKILLWLCCNKSNKKITAVIYKNGYFLIMLIVTDISSISNG